MREKLIEVMKDTRANAAWHRWSYEESADYLIENDVVPVVRCKDCKHYEKDTLSCGNILYNSCYQVPNWYADDFCSYGERKDNAD